MDMVAERVKKTRDATWEDQDDEGIHFAAPWPSRIWAAPRSTTKRITSSKSYFDFWGSFRSKIRPVFDTPPPSPVWGHRSGGAGRRHFSRICRTADCIVIEGSNMAECHPVAFRWVMKAQRARRNHHSCRPAIHPNQRRGGYSCAHSRRQRHRFPRRNHPLHSRERALFQRIRRQLHQRGRDHQRGVQGYRR